MSEVQHDALDRAARDALRAPSIFNTQPWTWRIDGAALELRPDWSRHLRVADSLGNELLLSCGAALHHARVSLAADGWTFQVEALRPGGEVLARITLVDRAPADPAAVRLREAIARRRTDRRPYADQPVPPDILAELATAAEAEGVALYRVRYDQMPMLAIAVGVAGATEMAQPEYVNELIRWTNRPEWSNDGVPAGTAVRKVPRRVPVREFVVAPQEGMPVTPGGDLGAAYLILHGPDAADPRSWLRAGQALSAVLLTAVSHGLAVAPITDVLEVANPRELVQSLVGGSAEPYALIRCGYPADDTVLPESPRRRAEDVIHSAPEE